MGRGDQESRHQTKRLVSLPLRLLKNSLTLLTKPCNEHTRESLDERMVESVGFRPRGMLTSDVSIISSRIMRTTLDIDDPILREVKAIHEREGRSIGAVVSELLAEALARRCPSRARPSFRWTSRAMKSLVDLADKETVYATIDADLP